jgi:DNA-binding CsgD family transcriptional regulator
LHFSPAKETNMLPYPPPAAFMPPAPPKPPCTSRESLFSGWLAAILDEIDYPMLLVGSALDVLHANRTALTTLAGPRPLQLVGQRLRARSPQDVAPLSESVEDAAERGLRRLLLLGREDDDAVWLAIVPLRRQVTDAAEGAPAGAALLVLAKRRMWQPLSVQSFGRRLRLTGAETTVLEALCDGLLPHEVAQRNGVAMSTVRTQINALRSKMGAQNICDLVRRVALLPPILGALGCGSRGKNEDDSPAEPARAGLPPGVTPSEQDIALAA